MERVKRREKGNRRSGSTRGGKRGAAGGEDGQRAGECRLCLAISETRWRRGEAFPIGLMSVKVPLASAAGTRSRGRWRARSPATLADIELAQTFWEKDFGRRSVEKKRGKGAGSRRPPSDAAPTQLPVPA